MIFILKVRFVILQTVKVLNLEKAFQRGILGFHMGGLGNFFIMSGSFCVDVISRGFFQSYRRSQRKREREKEQVKKEGPLLLKAI